jgi:hypothetical protein
MSENLLQFIWQFRLYNASKPLLTNEGLEVIVIHPGTLNKHAGPDFLEAKIKCAEIFFQYLFSKTLFSLEQK